MISIREANQADLVYLSDIYFKSRKKNFSWVDNPQKRDLYKAIYNEKVILAENEKRQIVGFASIDVRNSFLHLLFVDPMFEKQGIGQKLLDVSRETVPKALELKVVQENKGAIKFYEKNGLVKILVDNFAIPKNYTYKDVSRETK